MPRQQSMQTQMKGMKKGQMPSDFGMLPLTFVRPPNSQLPQLLSREWRHRLRIEWLWVKTRCQNFLSLLSFLRWYVPKDPLTRKRLSSPLVMSERVRVARELHKQYYAALVRADMAWIQENACSGLTTKSKIHIERMKNSGGITFKMLRYQGFNYPQKRLLWLIQPLLPRNAAKVVSDRASQLPIGSDSWVRQVVVRISSYQYMVRGTKKQPRGGLQTEYVVIQKTKINGVEDDWKIWGTIEPSSVKEIDEIIEGHATVGKQSITERLQEARDQMMDT